MRRLGAEFVVTADPDVIRSADRVLLPGVGNAAEAMANLQIGRASCRERV